MYIAYYDETGDDGFPNFSSKYFVLTSIYLHYLRWEDTLDKLVAFRKDLKKTHGIPMKMEFHTSNFLKKKKPFTGHNLSNSGRVGIINYYCSTIANLDIKAVDVCIVKNRITLPNYKVLDTALNYSIQRIQNDLQPKDNPLNKFLVITDEGRIGTMRKTTRKMRRVNYVPSQFGGPPRRIDINTLIEDPLPKNSKQSYFIQTADLISLIVYLYTCHLYGDANCISKRIHSYVGYNEIMNWMDQLKPSLNIRASRQNQYGVVFYPK